MALSRKEAVYFFRSKDDSGQPLIEGCNYRVAGHRLPARWWSLTIYAADDFLARNGDGAHSVSAASVNEAIDGSWQVAVGPKRAGNRNWLSSRNAGNFTLLVRLYNPQASALDAPTTLPLPTVTRLACSKAQT